MSALPHPPKRLKPEFLRVGDFAYCRSKRYRDSLQLPREVGVVLEIKRASHKILYASDRRAWVPKEALVRVAPSADSPELFRILNFMLRRVDAHECELASDETGVYQVSAQIDRIDHSTIDEIRAFLAGRFISLTVVPEGMAFMKVEILFR